MAGSEPITTSITAASTTRLIAAWKRLEHMTTHGRPSSGKTTRLMKPGFCSISPGARLMFSEKMPNTSSPENSTTANSSMLSEPPGFQRVLNTRPNTNV